MKITCFLAFLVALVFAQVAGAQDFSVINMSDGMRLFLRQLAKEDSSVARDVLRQIDHFMQDLKKSGYRLPGLEGVDVEGAGGNSYVATYATFKDPKSGKIIELRGLVSTFIPSGMEVHAIIRPPVIVSPKSSYRPPVFIERSIVASTFGRRLKRPVTNYLVK